MYGQKISMVSELDVLNVPSQLRSNGDRTTENTDSSDRLEETGIKLRTPGYKVSYFSTSPWWLQE